MNLQIDNRKEFLQNLFVEVINVVELNKRKYFHINTVENLIFHFDKIRTENDKNWVYENLLSYLTVCLKIGSSINKQIGEEMFYENIDKLTDYYYSNIGFSLLLNRELVYGIYILILIVCYFVFNFYIVIGLAILFSLITIRTFRKYKGKKVYGLFW